MIAYYAIQEADYHLLKDPERYLSAHTAADIFDVSVDTIQTLRQQVKITAYTIPGHKITRFKYSEIEKLLKPI